MRVIDRFEFLIARLLAHLAQFMALSDHQQLPVNAEEDW